MANITEELDIIHNDYEKERLRISLIDTDLRTVVNVLRFVLALQVITVGLVLGVLI